MYYCDVFVGEDTQMPRNSWVAVRGHCVMSVLSVHICGASGDQTRVIRLQQLMNCLPRLRPNIFKNYFGKYIEWKFSS